MTNTPLRIGSAGSPIAKIALVGEAWGATEARLHEPFVGLAGQKLNSVLSSVGILRSDCYITNVLALHPAKNNIKLHLDLSRKQPKMSDTYIQERANLIKELAQCSANVIVALGNTALFTLTGKRGILKWRGSILRSLPEFGSRKVIPTIHPRALITDPSLKVLATYDFMRIKSESETPDLANPYPTMYLENTYNEILEILQYINSQCKYVGFDIETYQFQISHISLAYNNKSICIPFLTDYSPVWTTNQEAVIWLYLAKILENPFIVKVAHNSVFDITMLYRLYQIVPKPIEDTMIAQAIVFPDLKKDLGTVTSMYTKIPYYKFLGRDYFKSHSSEILFRRYNALDSFTCLQAHFELQYLLKATKSMEVYSRQLALVYPLVFMSAYGIPVNTAKLDSMRKDCENLIKSLSTQLRSYMGAEINFGSPQQLMSYFYTQKRVKPYTHNGRLTIDGKALQRIARLGHKEAELLLSLRHSSKMLSTYYNAKLDSDARFRCSYNPVGTAQGRISSSKTVFGTGGNLQNQPPEMKHCFYADTGYIAFDIDLSQAENRVVAYVSDDYAMKEAFESHVDIHTRTASLIFDKPAQEITPEERSWGKRANHGLNYGMGYKLFALYYSIKENDAKYIVNRYHQIYPGVKRWHQRIKEQLHKDGTLVNCAPFFRRRTFRSGWTEKTYKIAYSFIPQSTVADIINWWGVCYLYYRLADTPIILLNQVHDSIVFELPCTMFPEDMASILRQVISQLEHPISYQGREFTIPAEIAAGYNLGKYSPDEPLGMIDLDKSNLVASVQSRLESYPW